MLNLIDIIAKCSQLSILILYKPETLTSEHKRVPFDSHYPPEQKKTVEEVEETGAEAMQRDFSIHADTCKISGSSHLHNYNACIPE